jgi:hypothetical protein
MPCDLTNSGVFAFISEEYVVSSSSNEGKARKFFVSSLQNPRKDSCTESWC